MQFFTATLFPFSNVFHTGTEPQNQVNYSPELLLTWVSRFKRGIQILVHFSTFEMEIITRVMSKYGFISIIQNIHF